MAYIGLCTKSFDGVVLAKFRYKQTVKRKVRLITRVRYSVLGETDAVRPATATMHLIETYSPNIQLYGFIIPAHQGVLTLRWKTNCGLGNNDADLLVMTSYTAG